MLKKISVWTVILWIIVWTIIYFLILPPINPGSLKFWAFFLPSIVLPLVLFLIRHTIKKDGIKKGKALWPIYVLIVGAVVFFGGMVVVSPVFNARNYAKRIVVSTSVFEEDIREVDFENLPLLDKISSQKVGDRVVGQVYELVSQFNVSQEYSLINYNGKIVRVSPLEHIDLYKYASNYKDGTLGYVLVDCTTREAKLVHTKSGLKYLPSAYLLKNLNIHVQLHYPFDILGETSFELDESGNPYWIIQTLRYSWINIKPQVTGVIVCDAITGKMEKYKVGQVPSWVDNVYDASLVLDEINSWGMYQGGFINSQFQQKNVVQATDGYTYITNNDDVYLYTGITSVAMDESNIGFVLVNLRTHEARYYAVAGAEEYSAMESALGAVQEKKYTSTFPLLINLNNRPTYLLSLKDDGGLVKMYGFVDVQNYQKVSVSDASYGIKYAADVYLNMMNGGKKEERAGDTTKEIVVETLISGIIIDNTSYYYVISAENERFEIPVSINVSVVPFLKTGDKVLVEYYTEDDLLNKVTAISLVKEEEKQEEHQEEQQEEQKKDEKTEAAENSEKTE